MIARLSRFGIKSVRHNLDILKLEGKNNLGPIMFYKRQNLFDGTLYPIYSFIQKTRELGFEIKTTSSDAAVRHGLKYGGQEFKNTQIVCFSTLQATLAYNIQLGKIVKRIDPKIITVIGGISAIPQLANLFDIVVEGEAEITLPAVLRFLNNHQKDFSYPVSQNTSPQNDFLKKVFLDDPWNYFIFDKQVADQMLKISSQRVIEFDDGKEISVDLPLGRALSIRTPDGILRFYEDTTLQKTSFFQSLNIPPEHQNKVWETLTSYYPIGDELDQFCSFPNEARGEGPDRKQFWIYSQRGCYGKCKYCSIKNQFGRTLSPEKVISLIEYAVQERYEKIEFGDELFIQNKKWVNQLLDLIYKKGLHNRIKFGAQTRVDCAPVKTILRLKKLGFQLDAGAETLLPEVAEQIGKAEQGKGKTYIKAAHKFIETLMSAEGPQRGDLLFMILATRGKSFLQILKDLKEMALVSLKIKTRFNKIPQFSFGLEQLPLLNDRITPEESELANLTQPGTIDTNQINKKRFNYLDFSINSYKSGNVLGELILLSPVAGDKSSAHSIFIPEKFSWPSGIINFIYNFYSKFNKYNIGEAALLAMREVLENKNYTGTLLRDRKEIEGVAAEIEEINKQFFRVQPSTTYAPHE